MQKSRGNKTELQALIKDNVTTEDSEEIDKVVEEFYQKLYEKGSSKLTNAANLKPFLRNLEKLDAVNIDEIDKPLTISDLRNTLNSCRDSAPGPDGIPYSIIKLTWNFFGPILLDSWNYANLTGNLTHSHEDSYLKLLPKEGKDLKLLKIGDP